MCTARLFSFQRILLLNFHAKNDLIGTRFLLQLSILLVSAYQGAKLSESGSRQ